MAPIQRSTEANARVPCIMEKRKFTLWDVDFSTSAKTWKSSCESSMHLPCFGKSMMSSKISMIQSLMNWCLYCWRSICWSDTNVHFCRKNSCYSTSHIRSTTHHFSVPRGTATVHYSIEQSGLKKTKFTYILLKQSPAARTRLDMLVFSRRKPRIREWKCSCMTPCALHQSSENKPWDFRERWDPDLCKVRPHDTHSLMDASVCLCRLSQVSNVIRKTWCKIHDRIVSMSNK